jgi:hypothetical protein
MAAPVPEVADPSRRVERRTLVDIVERQVSAAVAAGDTSQPAARERPVGAERDAVDGCVSSRVPFVQGTNVVPLNQMALLVSHVPGPPVPAVAPLGSQVIVCCASTRDAMPSAQTSTTATRPTNFT